MAHIRDEVHAKAASKVPSRKVGSAALAGAIVTIAVYVGRLFELELPPEVSSAAVTVLSFATSYLVRD